MNKDILFCVLLLFCMCLIGATGEWEGGGPLQHPVHIDHLHAWSVADWNGKKSLNPDITKWCCVDTLGKPQSMLYFNLAGAFTA